MISLIKAEKPYKPEIGDLVCQSEESVKYLCHSEDPATDKIIPLGCADPNPWEALRVFAINAKPIITKYTCPYTKYEHFGIVPVALLLRKDNVYNVKFHSADYLMDWAFHRHNFKKDRLKLFNIPKILLGSGYTDGTGHYDGSGSSIQRPVMLENGDALWCHFHEWYNK